MNAQTVDCPSRAATIGRVKQLDRGLVLALILAFFAAAPFLTRPGLPHQTDAELHVYRAAELGRVIQKGVFYPRWAPNLYLGYGYPIFNYYAPLTYYVANAFAVLPGVDIVGGVKAVFVLGLVVASIGAYLLGRDLFTPAGGILSAASFTFAPYIVFIDPHVRGDLAEHFAICLLPLAFYFFQRLAKEDARAREALLGGTLTLAALVFSHNLLGLVSGGLLLAYWAWEVVFGTGRARAGQGLLAIALAAAIIAFFWLPALWERSAVKLMVTDPGHFDFHNHFVSLRELLAPSRLVDWGATAPRKHFNLGLAQWVLALPMLGTFLCGRGSAGDRWERYRRTLAYFGLSALGLIILMLPVSSAVWERVPGMPYLQFPWRLLGPTNLMLAVCAAGGATLLPASRWRNPVLAVSSAAILLLALPVLYPLPWPPEFGSTAAGDVILWEMRSQALGTTSTGDFLPVDARAGIVPMPSLVESYLQPGPVDKVNRATLPDGARIEIVEHGPLHDRFEASAPRKFQLRLYTFYFPGWHAYVDGKEVSIEVAQPEGFITLWVPEGDHGVLVRFEDTPPRTVGWVISAAGLVTLTAVLTLLRSQRTEKLCSAAKLGTRSLIWLGGALALVVALKGVIDLEGSCTLHYNSPPGRALAAEHELRANFGGKIELLGYDLPRRRVRPGQKLPVVLYWRALTPLEKNYKSFVHLAQPLDVLWGQEDHLNPAGLPTERWPLTKYVRDPYEIRVSPETPPGEYRINVGLYLESENRRLQRYDDGGQVIGDSVVIGSFDVVR